MEYSMKGSMDLQNKQTKQWTNGTVIPNLPVINLNLNGSNYPIKRHKITIKKKKQTLEFLSWLSGNKSHQYPEDMGLIPGLAQWVKDLVLPWTVV